MAKSIDTSNFSRQGLCSCCGIPLGKKSFVGDTGSLYCSNTCQEQGDEYARQLREYTQETKSTQETTRVGRYVARQIN